MSPETKKLVRLIKEDGWHEVKIRKSGHIQFIHPTKPGRVTIPCRNVKKNITKSVLRQAGLSGSLTDFKNGRISQNLVARSDFKH